MIGWLSQFFVNLPLLLGVTAAAIPIILHLVYRKRAPRVMFSTLRFLRMSAERTSRRRRIQEWLLLLLRAGALFLLALALAGPVLRSASRGRGGSAAAAIVMDNSFSMAARFEGRSRYMRAREYALDILRHLGEQGQAAVVFAWPGAEEYGKETLSADRNRLADETAASDVSFVVGDLSAAISRAEKLLQDAPTRQREIYVLTDLQKATWRELRPPETLRGPALIIVDCAPGAQGNVSVDAVHVAAVRPAAGAPVRFVARVRNHGDAPQAVNAALYVGRDKRAERSLELAAAATAEVDFVHTFERAGVHTGWVDIEADDPLQADNRRYFCLDVPDRIQAAVVREQPGALPTMDEAFFLIPALNPLGGGVGSTIEPVPMLREELAGRDLSGFAAVFLLNLPRFSDKELSTLAEYVRSGGGLVIFPGDLVDVAAWNTSWGALFSDEKGMLPARFGAEPLAAASGGEPLVVESVENEHPVFAALGRMPARFYESVQIRRCLDLQVEHGSRAQVLARLNDGKPFLVEKDLGQGRALLFCVPATAAWSNLPTRTLFLPLIHQVTYYLGRSRSVAADYTAGSVVRFLPHGGKAPEVDVSLPDGTVTRSAPRPGDTIASFSRTADPGIYSWRDVAQEKREGAFVVNPLPEESDLTAWTRKELAEKMLAGRKAEFAKDAREALSIAARLREGRSLASPILFLVIALFLAECFLANRGGGGTPVKTDKTAAGMATA